MLPLVISHLTLRNSYCLQEAQYIPTTVCGCDVNYSVRNGIGAITECEFTNSFTIENSAISLKAKPSYRGEYTYRGVKKSEVNVVFEEVKITIDLPDPIPDVVVTLQPALLALTALHGRRLAVESCEVTYGEKPCNSCEPCGDYVITFDCSNINLFNDTYPVYLPFDPNLCVGLGEPLRLDGAPNSVEPFDPNQAV